MKSIKENKHEGNSLRTIIKDHTLRQAVESIGAWEHVSFRSIGALGTFPKENAYGKSLRKTNLKASP